MDEVFINSNEVKLVSLFKWLSLRVLGSKINLFKIMKTFFQQFSFEFTKNHVNTCAKKNTTCIYL